MAARESAALVALLRLDRRSRAPFAERVEEVGSALVVLEQELSEPRGNQPSPDDRQASLMPEDPAPMLTEASADLDRWAAEGIRIVSVLDDDYPVNLRAVHDRPALIFVTGRLERSDARSVAVIGARRASCEGIARAQALTAHLVAEGYTVISGLAAGIDTAAHQAALAAGGRTIAVLGTGVTRTYPPENAALQRELAERCAVISQFWPCAPPTRDTFPLRNATMSGLSLGTVVVQASERSGVRIQARLALAHGRPVFLPRALLALSWARELAQRPGTHLIDSPGEITVRLGRLAASDALTP